MVVSLQLPHFEQITVTEPKMEHFWDPTTALAWPILLKKQIKISISRKNMISPHWKCYTIQFIMSNLMVKKTK